MFSFLRLPFLFCMLMFTQSIQAEPDFKIPSIQESKYGRLHAGLEGQDSGRSSFPLS